MKNHIKLKQRINYFLNHYELLPIRASGYDSRFGENNYSSFAINNAYLKRNTKTRRISIITNEEEPKILLKEGLYTLVDCNKYIFLVINEESQTLCCYDYEGINIFAIAMNKDYDFRLYNATPRSKWISNSIFNGYIGVRDTDDIYHIYDETGYLIEDAAEGINSYNGVKGKSFIAYYKNGKTYVIKNDNTVYECDVILEPNNYELPIVLGTYEKVKGQYEHGSNLTKKFVTITGEILDIEFSKIENSNDKSLWMITNKDGMQNYIDSFGNILCKKWFYDSTKFHHGYSFVRDESLHGFYKLIDRQGNYIPNPTNIMIRNIITTFRHVYINNEHLYLAHVNVREFGDDGISVYRDYECFCDEKYNFYKLG